MNKVTKILTVACITVFIFPVLAQAEFFVRKYVGHMPLPSLTLLFAIFLPTFLKAYYKNGLRDLSSVYLNMTWITLPFLMVSVISIVWSLHPGAYWGGGLRQITMDLYHWVLLIISITIAQSGTFRKHHRIILLIVLMGSCIAVWVDYLNPGTFSKMTHRAAGFTTNPNDGARVIVLLCIAAIDWKKNGWMSLIILTCSGFTIYATLSLGTLLLFFSVVGYYLFVSITGEKKDLLLKKVSLVVAVPLLIVFLVNPMLTSMKNSEDSFDNRTSQKRLDKITNFFSGDFSFIKDHSRKDLVDQYWKIISEAPVVGHGTGYSSKGGRSGTHNMYLKYWVENGLLGLLIYFSLIAGIFWHFYTLRDKRGLIFVFVLFWTGFVTHNLLHDKTVVVLLGIIGTLAYLNNPKAQKKQPMNKQLTHLERWPI